MPERKRRRCCLAAYCAAFVGVDLASGDLEPFGHAQKSRLRALMNRLDGRSLDLLGIEAGALGKLATGLLDELQILTFECDRNALHHAIVQS